MKIQKEMLTMLPASYWPRNTADVEVKQLNPFLHSNSQAKGNEKRRRWSTAPHGQLYRFNPTPHHYIVLIMSELCPTQLESQMNPPHKNSQPHKILLVVIKINNQVIYSPDSHHRQDALIEQQEGASFRFPRFSWSACKAKCTGLATSGLCVNQHRPEDRYTTRRGVFLSWKEMANWRLCVTHQTDRQEPCQGAERFMLYINPKAK